MTFASARWAHLCEPDVAGWSLHSQDKCKQMRILLRSVTFPSLQRCGAALQLIPQRLESLKQTPAGGEHQPADYSLSPGQTASCSASSPAWQTYLDICCQTTQDSCLLNFRRGWKVSVRLELQLVVREAQKEGWMGASLPQMLSLFHCCCSEGVIFTANKNFLTRSS